MILAVAYPSGSLSFAALAALMCVALVEACRKGDATKWRRPAAIVRECHGKHAFC
jgi:hypothetical protein